MDIRNENPPTIDCRFLREDDFASVHETFLEAFSDYLITFQLTREQLRRHILLNAVDIELSVGCFSEGKMVGFTLNGFGMWAGRSTIYDAGTGVTPEFRRMGLSRAMFDLIFPMCGERKIEQCLLEVITKNDRAIKLYEQLGFYPSRTLMLLESKGVLKPAVSSDGVGVEIREMSRPDWPVYRQFWDGEPSWQNSVEAIERSLDLKKILGAFIGGECVGYVIFSANLGRVAQMAVSKDHRRKGIGSKLLLALESHAKEAESFQVINVDDSLTEVAQFFRNRGFVELLSQYEMIKQL